jgi:hypothetical protein
MAAGTAGKSGSNTPSQLPSGYVSGTELSDQTTFSNQTFATLDVTPGTYTYTWGSGATADSLTLVAGSPVPEPSTWAALLCSLGILGVVQRFRRACRM